MKRKSPPLVIVGYMAWVFSIIPAYYTESMLVFVWSFIFLCVWLYGIGMLELDYNAKAKA